MTPRSTQPEQPDVGQRLAAARLQRGLSQGTVARRAGLSPSYLSRIENGKIQPGFPMVLRISKALRAAIDEIVGPQPIGVRRGACPVSAHGKCLLDLIRPEGEPDRKTGEERYSPREIRLLRRVARWLKSSRPDRLRAMEILLEDLTRGVERDGRA